MKQRLLLSSLILLFSFSLFSQDILPKPGEIPKEYRSEYRKDLKEVKQVIRESDSDIQLPIEEMVPIEKLTPSEFSSSDFTNWGKSALAPGDVIARIIEAAKYYVFVDVYDTGIDEDHPDAQKGKQPSRDGISEPGGDRNGHGTHVWTTIMGERGGLMYELVEAGLLEGRATKVLNASGSGSFSTYAGMHETGFTDDYKGIVDAGGFVVTNQSLGYNGQPINYVEAALKEGYEYGGITHVAAAGNSNSDVDYPGSSPYTLAIGAVDQNLKRASFSCYGPKLTAAAPGVAITAGWKDGNYATISGTSMASPFVAAWCAAAYSVWGPKLKAPGAMEAYLSGILRDLGDEGRDDYYGYGLAVLNEIVDTDPDGVDPPDNPDNPGEPSDPPVDFISSVTFEVDGEVFRYRTPTATSYDLMKVDDLQVTVSCKCTEEQAYKLGSKTIADYFDFTTMVIPDEPEFGYATTSWWVGQFLEYQARQKQVELQVKTLRGTDGEGRNAIAVNFDRATVKAINNGIYFGKTKINNVVAIGTHKTGLFSGNQTVILQSLN